MSGSFERLHTGRALTWRTILGLLLVPLTAAGVLLWGLWNPTDRLETVTAAVVNLDEPVTVDGQMVPMGRVLAAELIGSDRKDDDDTVNFDWVLTDEADAEAGLDDGRYATVITIPENFSSAATSMSRGADEAEKATIDIATSERGRLLDSALSSIVTTTATSVLNQQLGTQFVGQVFVGMTEIGNGIGKAADGAKQLADGTVELAKGVAEFGAGVGELSTGASALATGASGLADGASALAEGARAAAVGGSQLADGVGQYTALVNQVVGGVIDNSAEAIAPLQQVRDLVAMIPAEAWPADADATQQETLDGLDALIAELTAAAGGSTESQLVQLKMAGEGLAAGTRASADGQAQLATGLEEYAAGASEFSTGMGAFASGTAEAAAGATLLADGAKQASDGTVSLADGLQEAADGIPKYTEDEAERMAETAVQPVKAEGANDELFNASGVPLFAGIALWAGAFASFLVLAPLWRRTREAAKGVGFITLRSALPAVLIGGAQGAIAGLVLPFLLGYDFVQGVNFFWLAVVAGASFSLVNQGLSALFGGFGRFLSFALLVVAFAIGVISTAPPLLQSIGDGSPIGALFGGFQAIAMGTSGLPGAFAALVVWGLGGLVLTAFAVARRRRTLTA